MLFPLAGQRSTDGLGRHNRQMDPPTGRFQHALYRRSIMYMSFIYNLLPQSIVDCKNVQEFQAKLTQVARVKCLRTDGNWKTFLSARSYDMSRILNNPRFRLF